MCQNDMDMDMFRRNILIRKRPKQLTVRTGTAGQVMKALEPTTRRERMANRSIIILFGIVGIVG